MEEERNLEGVPAPRTASRRWLITPMVLLALISFAYAVRERRQAAQWATDAARLAAENKQLTTSLSQTQSEVDALAAKLNAMSIQPSAAPAPSPQPAEAQRAAIHKAGGSRTVQNRQWMKIEGQLAEQQKAIASTQRDLENARTDLEGKLSSARDELNGSIARTHDELVALEKKGERNYYEFDLAKSKQFQHVGPLSLSLRKTNSKHEYYDMTMVVDDRQLDKKHVNLYEALLIYPADSHQPLEIVVNKISKDEVQGYISAPKYTESQHAASGVTAGTASTPAPSGNVNGSTAPEGSSPTQATLSQRPSLKP